MRQERATHPLRPTLMRPWLMQAMQLSQYFTHRRCFLEDESSCQPAGFGAAKHLAETGYNVTLVDAAPNPGGLSAGWRTPQGRAVEAGIKGFWYQARFIT